MRFAHKIFHLADIDNMQSNKQEKHNVYCINLYFRLLNFFFISILCDIVCVLERFPKRFFSEKENLQIPKSSVRR